MSSILLTSLGQRESILKGVSGQHEEIVTQVIITQYPCCGQPSMGKKELQGVYCFTIHNSL